MERFVIKQNIEHYRAMLKIATDLERSLGHRRSIKNKSPAPVGCHPPMDKEHHRACRKSNLKIESKNTPEPPYGGAEARAAFGSHRSLGRD